MTMSRALDRPEPLFDAAVAGDVLPMPGTNAAFFRQPWAPILTAVGMTDHLVVMVIAVITAVIVMLLAADPLAGFIHRNPTVVMLALGFLLMIGAVLIADGFGVHVPKGYIYTAMTFSAGVEALNIWSRRRRQQAVGQSPAAEGDSL